VDDARLTVARYYDFVDWRSLADYVNAVSREGPFFEFESAVEAVVNGGLAGLEDALRHNPDLVRARSRRICFFDPPLMRAIAHRRGHRSVMVNVMEFTVRWSHSRSGRNSGRATGARPRILRHRSSQSPGGRCSCRIIYTAPLWRLSAPAAILCALHQIFAETCLTRIRAGPAVCEKYAEYKSFTTAQNIAAAWHGYCRCLLRRN
jgi:hypothetical protein